MSESATKTCPYCKEDVLVDAILCKHCRSALSPEKPEHGGICPYCKEKIKEEALKCKHCLSSLAPDKSGGCECTPTDIQALRLRRPGTTPTGGSDCSQEYGDCYLDCQWDHADGTLAQYSCLKSCDRKIVICDSTGHWPRVHFGSGRFSRF